jgi:hypothetical protein
MPSSRRRKKHTGRNISISAGAIAALVIAMALANSGSGSTHTIATGSTTAAAASSSASHQAPVAKEAAAKAGIGTSIVLAGIENGEQMTVTLVKVVRHAVPASQFDAPDAGKRLYAVQFRLADTGPAAYSDSPGNGAQIIDSSGQSYTEWVSSVTGCQSFPGSKNISPGSSGLGCIVFEVPAGAFIVSVQFTLDSGMGPQTGQWNVSIKR